MQSMRAEASKESMRAEASKESMRAEASKECCARPAPAAPAGGYMQGAEAEPDDHLSAPTEVAWSEHLESSTGAGQHLSCDELLLAHHFGNEELNSSQPTLGHFVEDAQHYRSIDLEEVLDPSWLEPDELLYRGGFLMEDGLDPMPAEEELLFRSADETPVFRSLELDDEVGSLRIEVGAVGASAAALSAEVAVDGARRSSCGPCLGEATGLGSFMLFNDDDSVDLRADPLGGLMLADSPGKVDLKSNSCSDIHRLLRKEREEIAMHDRKPSAVTAPVDLQGGPLYNIETLDLSVTELFGWGLQFLGQLRHLKSLNLFSTKVSDEGLVHIAGHRSLVDLNLCGTNITDMGLQHLLGLVSLEELKVSGNKGITDDGARRLFSCLESLRTLEMRQTSVTPACSFQIQEALATRGM